MKNQLENKRGTMERIAIIGSRTYTNKRKIKEFIFGLKEKFKDELEVVSGGAREGADKYNKPYNVGNYHRRNQDIVNYVDKVVAFCTNGKVTNGTASGLKYAKKIDKKFIIID